MAAEATRSTSAHIPGRCRGRSRGRRRPDARRQHAAADPGSAARGGNGHSRPARPPPRRAGREFLAIPPLCFRRARCARRLAALGARRSSLCARTGMGGRAYGMDLARPFAVDALCLAAGPRHQALPHAGRRARARRGLGRRRRARRHSRSVAADRQPQYRRTDRAGDRARSQRAARACRRILRPPRSPRSCCCPTCGAISAKCAAPSRSSPAAARTATWCRSSIRPRRRSPIGAASNSSSRKAAAASPPAAPKPGAPIIPRALPATAPRSAARPTGSALALRFTAPTARRANCCSRCTPASAPAPRITPRARTHPPPSRVPA